MCVWKLLCASGCVADQVCGDMHTCGVLGLDSIESIELPEIKDRETVNESRALQLLVRWFIGSLVVLEYEADICM